MMKRLGWWRREAIGGLLVPALIAIAGCGGGDAPAAGGQAGPGQGGPGGPGGRPALPPAPVAVAAAVQGPIASYYGATASLEAEKEAEVLARAEGVVETVKAEEGDTVASGGLLMRINNAAYRYRVDQAAARTAQLRAAFERLRLMRVEEVATEEEFETARANLADAEAAEDLAKLDLSYTAVKAPFTGVVTQRFVDRGQNVSMGMSLYTVADVTPLLARVHVPSREFRQLDVGQDVELVLDSSRTSIAGRIKLVSPIIDPASGTIKVTVEVPEYPAGTRPGDFVEVRIVTERRLEATLVPRVAVVTEKGESVAYVAVDSDSTTVAERRPVEVGFSDGDLAQILSGVAVGERVVVRGQRSLKPDQPLKVLEGPGAEPAGEDGPGKKPGGPGPGQGGRGGRGH